MLKKVRNIVYLFSSQRIRSNWLVHSPVDVRAGFWRGRGRIYWQNNEDLVRISRMFLGFYGATAGNGRLRHRLLQVVLEWIVSPVFKSKAGQRDATVVWFTRNQSFMYFDFNKMEVITVVSDEIQKKLCNARRLDLFSYFLTPTFVIEQDRHGFHVKREPLYELPCIGLQTWPQQQESVRQITGICVRYTHETSLDPQPSLFEKYFDEVAACIEPPDRAKMETQRKTFNEFVNDARIVESHLDFNVANFLGGGQRPLVLLDIADAGLLLPATYDANNLLLNEVFALRSIHLLLSALDSPERLGYQDLLQKTLGRSSIHDFKSSLFANFVLRESTYVTFPLGVKWSPERIRRSWQIMKNRVIGWPFDVE
jgi:hypothetical protein